LESVALNYNRIINSLEAEFRMVNSLEEHSEWSTALKSIPNGQQPSLGATRRKQPCLWREHRSTALQRSSAWSTALQTFVPENGTLLTKHVSLLIALHYSRDRGNSLAIWYNI